MVIFEESQIVALKRYLTDLRRQQKDLADTIANIEAIVGYRGESLDDVAIRIIRRNKMAGNTKIDAIKEYRAETDASLLEAKVMIADKWWHKVDA